LFAVARVERYSYGSTGVLRYANAVRLSHHKGTMPQKLIDVDAVIAALDSERLAKNLSWRQVAKAAGVSPSTLTRMQQGKSPDVNTFTALSQWLNIPAEKFHVEKSPLAQVSDDPMAVVSTLFRGRKKMNPKALAALQELVNAAFKLSKELK
jgi:transcriptional regulator with XRE-family HTH domain